MDFTLLPDCDRLNQSVIKQTFLSNIINNYENYVLLYTDGSKTINVTGNTKLRYPLK